MAQGRMRLIFKSPAKRPHEARLADARFARQQHHLALTLLGSLPVLEQQADLILATDKRRQACPVQRLEPALGSAFPDHAPRPYRNGKPLQDLQAELGELEQPANELPGAGG